MFLIVNPKNFICLMCMVKKFWILAASFGGTSHFGTPKFGQILFFVFSFVKFHVSSLKG